jgi:hypothetical protein
MQRGSGSCGNATYSPRKGVQVRALVCRRANTKQAQVGVDTKKKKAQVGVDKKNSGLTADFKKFMPQSSRGLTSMVFPLRFLDSQFRPGFFFLHPNSPKLSEHLKESVHRGNQRYRTIHFEGLGVGSLQKQPASQPVNPPTHPPCHQSTNKAQVGVQK